jgi:mannose-1-phosphate guanylyltransferase/mannose-6-phosphate isomerase
MLHAVILAGGGGERLWPLSRTTYPKQFLSLLSNATFLQQTIHRIAELIPPQRMWIVTGSEHKEVIQSQLALLLGHDAQAVPVLTEPFARNTAPAIGLAAVHIQRVDPEASLLVLPADHWIERPTEFCSLIRRALQLVVYDQLVTFGIVPDRPETGYGYIKRGRPFSASPMQLQHPVDAYQVERFVEKPAKEVAERYVVSGDYYWNAGIFLWRGSVLLREISRYLPELYASLQKIESSVGLFSFAEVLEQEYARLPVVSIDTGVLEKSSRLLVVPADIEWSDLGEWNAIHRLSPQDAQGNTMSPSVVDLESRHTFVYGNQRPIVTIGLENTIVIDGEDAVLVCAQERTQDVKRAIQQLQIRKPEVVHTPRTMQRSWGTYTVLDRGVGFKVKRIVVAPGASLSLQLHHHRSEHWVVVRGIAEVTNGEHVSQLSANQSTYISAGTKHRLSNPGVEPLEIVEVQTGSYVEEDDIIRFFD